MLSDVELRVAAETAEHWPPGHAKWWGRTADGEWTGAFAQIAPGSG